MKSIIIKISLVLLTAIFFSCSNEVFDEINIKSNTMEVTKYKFNSSHKAYNNIISVVNSSKLNLDFSDAFVVNNSWSPFEIVAVPIVDSEKYYSFFSNHELSQPFIASGTESNATITDEEGNVIGQISNTLQKSTLINTGFIELVRSATRKLSKSTCDCHGVDSCENHQYDRMENCGAYDFGECMTCAEDICDQDTKCRYGRTWTGPLYVISVAAHCAL